MRGDGSLNDNQTFSMSYFKNILNSQNYYTKDGQVEGKNVIFIELHIAGNRRKDNILEVNIYSLIPSIEELKNYYSNNNKKFFEDLPQKGNSLERIKIKRIENDKIDITVEVDGIFSESLTSIYRNIYFWNLLPRSIINIYRALSIGEEINDKLFNFNGVKISDVLKNFVVNNEIKLRENTRLFESFLMQNYYNFDWLIYNIIPEKIRDKEYERLYPTFMLVSNIEWDNSLNKQLIEKKDYDMFCIVVGRLTQRKDDGTYYTIKDPGDTSLEKLLDDYKENKLTLIYDKNRHSISNSNWVKSLF